MIFYIIWAVVSLAIMVFVANHEAFAENTRETPQLVVFVSVVAGCLIWPFIFTAAVVAFLLERNDR